MLDADDVGEWGLTALLLLVGSAVLTFLIIAATMSARSSGSPDYCYLKVAEQREAMLLTYRLMEHRPWSVDMVAGVFPTFNEAATAAERMGCPFRSAP
jgi:hypothetical protein